MIKFTQHTGKAAPLYRSNIDTDQIIPKQFLKRIERTGYGAFLFYDWRFNSDETANTEFVLNAARYDGSSVLIAGANFGCGSSREHAPWSLLDYGIRVVIAPGFADIFYNNSLKNGLLPVSLNEDQVAELVRKTEAESGFQVSIDLAEQLVTDENGFNARFDIDPFRKHCLLNGLDDIALTLEHEKKITEYELNTKKGSRFSYLQS